MKKTYADLTDDQLHELAMLVDPDCTADSPVSRKKTATGQIVHIRVGPVLLGVGTGTIYSEHNLTLNPFTFVKFCQQAGIQYDNDATAR